jgi:hypothetical protein
MDALKKTLVLSLSAAAAACAATTPAPEAAPANAMPAAVVVERSITLTLTAGGSELALACQQQEPALANGVDDDCDGRVDGEAAQGNELLSISLVRRSDVDLTLALRASDGQLVAPSTTRTSGACDTAAPFALTQTDFETLAPGSYEVVVAEGPACKGKQPPFAHVALRAANGQAVAVGLSVAAEPVVIATAVVR